VDYEVYGGRLIHAIFVRPDVEKIFKYRQWKLRELFGENAMSETQQRSCDAVVSPTRLL
jgi:hypothetical protein